MNKYFYSPPDQSLRLKNNVFLYIFEKPVRSMMEWEALRLCAINCHAQPGITQWFIDAGRITKKKIYDFRNGSKSILLPGRHALPIGCSGNVIINDFDLRSDQEELYRTALPCTIWGGKLEILCQHNQSSHKDTFLSRLIREAEEVQND